MIVEVRPGPGGGAMSVGEIERELARLRMNEDGSPLARASVLNLVAVTDEEAAGDVSRVVNALSASNPCRAIVLISDPDEVEANLEIGLSAFCSGRDGGGKQVCAEQITVHVEGPPAGHLDSLAGPLLVPDLPVFLWYPNGDVPSSPECAGLAALADRIILDSGAFSDATGDCASALRGAASLCRECVPAVGDLQWCALSPWRLLLAELFSPPERAGELADLRRVEILHSPEGECRAMLFVGWLSTALGWRPEGVERAEEGRAFRFASGTGEKVVVELSGVAEDAPLRRVRLYSGACSFQISRYGEHADARSTVMRGGELLGERTVHLGSSDAEALLAEELRLLGRDEVYEAALARAVALLDL